MKKILTLSLFLAMSSLLFAQTFTPTTITAIQQVAADSLKAVDSAGIVTTGIWTKQASPKINQKVEVVGLVKIPPYEITFNSGGRTMVLTDTGAAAGKAWSSIVVLYGSDNTATLSGGKWTGGTFDNNGYNSIKRGDIIRIRGTVTEFPTPQTVSLTQIAPDTNQSVLILSSGNPVPQPPLMKVADFNTGPNPGGHTNFITGEQWESGEVMFTNLTVNAVVTLNRGTWQATDSAGNTISMYDWSTHWTMAGAGTINGITYAAARNPARDTTYFPPAIGSKIDTIRGYIATASGGEATRGFRIAPIFRSDVKFGIVLPGLTTHRRTPIVVAKDSDAVISAKIFKQAGGSGIKSAKLVYRVNGGAWVESTMVAKQASVDSIFGGRIPKQAVGAVVNYFLLALDSNSQSTILASNSNANSGQLTAYDTSKGFFLYKVLDRTAQPVLTIRDVQSTPFLNGVTPYMAAVDSVGGIITADTANILKAARSQGGATVYFMQSGNQPFSGVWVVGPDSVMKNVLNGDSVVVRGTITEFNNVTEIFAVTSARIVSRGNAIPAPVLLKTEQFGTSVSNGNLSAEPYEGMLVKFDSLTVTSIDPVFNDFYAFEVKNSTSAMLVGRDGKNSFSNNPADTIPGISLLRVGNKIKSLTGVMHYFNGRYKLTPRTNADFGTVTGVKISRNEVAPEQYTLGQNYPNPFNPTTNIQYGLPVSGRVTLKVYNVLGQEMMTLVNETQNAGVYTVNFDASKFSSGMYLYRITSGNFVQVKKMLLLK
ncbi:MAG: T9SS type A sorting domain-containing protein [Bacteroidota bacterium]